MPPAPETCQPFRRARPWARAGSGIAAVALSRSTAYDLAPLSFDEFIDRYHRAADAFSRGDPGPVKDLYSGSDDVTLANPFGPARRGSHAVMDALDYASCRMRDGQVTEFDEVARYTSDDLATILEIEHWRARIGDRSSSEPFQLRVTTTFRRENGEWRIVHRHADPISSDDESGPLRTS